MSTATLERTVAPGLRTQLQTVKQIMSDGRFRTLEEIALIAKQLSGNKATVPSISARLRDLRKAKYGGFKVERSIRSPGLFEYRVLVAEAQPDTTPAKAAAPPTFNTQGTQSGRLKGDGGPNEAAKPVAGSRSASSYIESLKNGGK